MADPNEAAAVNAALEAIGKSYYDVTIICTTDDYQASYWMNILENGLLMSSSNNKVLAVSEDWNDKGGAGNGLGTLYAWKKACTLASSKYGDNFNLFNELMNGTISAALYHTAGKGTRLAPLPASENNNKPGVKLPFPLMCTDGTVKSLSVLESVIRQTGIYARKGRLSVFWGDQVFIPTTSFIMEPTHHIDIQCTLLGDTAPNATEWVEQGLDKYGVIVVLSTGEAAQVEKVSHSTAMSMLSELPGTVQQVGPSLGSFSVSAVFLQALMNTFDMELIEKTSKFDTDPHFWMPLTLPESSYVSLMKQKGVSEIESTLHYTRMQHMKSTFLASNTSSSLGLFGAVNVGKSACWWDYGQLKLYSTNCLLLLDQEKESAKLLRRYLGLTDEHLISSNTMSTSIDTISYVITSKIESGTISNSLLSNVTTKDITADGAIIINCTAKKITAGKKAIVYNVIATDENEEIIANDGDIIVGVLSADGTTNIRVKSRIDIDGGTVWKQVLNDGTTINELSFEQIHTNNYNANIIAISDLRQQLYNTIVSKLGM